MVAQSQKPVSLFPDCPRQDKLVDEKGFPTQTWKFFFDQQTNALQKILKNEGFLLPLLTAAELATIEALYTPFTGSPGTPLPQNVAGNISGSFLADISGQMVFDSTNRVPKIFIITYDGSTPPNVLTARWWTFTIT